MLATDGIFAGGSLEMPVTRPDPAAFASAWSDLLVNRILCVVAILLFLAVLMDWLRLMPTLVDCLSRVRANIGLEHSLNQARSRNYVAMVVALAFCLIADRYGLYDPSYFGYLSPGWHALLTIGTFFVFLLLRHILYLVGSPSRLSSEQTLTARRVLYSAAIVLVTLQMLTVVIVSLVGVPDAVTRKILIVEMAVLYAVSLLRTGQIFALHCNGLATILYLCALEILPCGILVFTSTL